MARIDNEIFLFFFNYFSLLEVFRFEVCSQVKESNASQELSINIFTRCQTTHSKLLCSQCSSRIKITIIYIYIYI